MSEAAVRVVFLGTGGALNTERGQAAILVEALGTRVLLDVGGSLETVRRLLRAGIDPGAIDHIVLSHRHLDHAGGLEPFLLWLAARSRQRGTPLRHLALHASPETMAAVRAAFTSLDAAGEQWCGEACGWVPSGPGEAVPLTGGELRLVAADHGSPGRLPGAVGCVLDLAGLRLAYSGDTRPNPALAEAARGVDLLIHEAGGLDADAERVHFFGHSTAGDAGRLAVAAGARVLALTHLPASAPLDRYVAEAQAPVPGAELFLAEDGLVYSPPARNPQVGTAR